MRYLLLLFIAIPIVEMWLLITVGQHFGAVLTVALVLTTAVIGVYWLRQQGFSTLTRLNQRLSSGQLPAREIAESVILTVGGALLLTPGFATDLLGFSCLFPFTRVLWANLALSRIQAHIKAGVMTNASMMGQQGGWAGFSSSQSASRSDSQQSADTFRSVDANDVIDGEYSRED